jgi:hypothetical protein
MPVATDLPCFTREDDRNSHERDGGSDDAK